MGFSPVQDPRKANASASCFCVCGQDGATSEENQGCQPLQGRGRDPDKPSQTKFLALESWLGRPFRNCRFGKPVSASNTGIWLEDLSSASCCPTAGTPVVTLGQPVQSERLKAHSCTDSTKP